MVVTTLPNLNDLDDILSGAGKTGKLQEMTGNFSEIVTGCPRASGAAAGRAAKIHKIPGSGKGFL